MNAPARRRSPEGRADVVSTSFSLDALRCYLKALGILRAVNEQKDREARGCWRNGHFELESKLDRQGLTDFFLDEYAPTPIRAMGSTVGLLQGWFGAPFCEAIDQIMRSTGERFGRFRMQCSKFVNCSKG